MTKTPEQKVVENWEKATQELAEVFAKKYFKDYDYFWVGDRIGDVFCVEYYFFGLDRMREALEYKATFDQLIDYYELELENIDGNGQPERPLANFKNYVKYGVTFVDEKKAPR